MLSFLLSLSSFVVEIVAREKVAKSLLIFFCSLVPLSCASMMLGEHQRVPVSSDDDGVDVKINGEQADPCRVRMIVRPQTGCYIGSISASDILSGNVDFDQIAIFSNLGDGCFSLTGFVGSGSGRTCTDSFNFSGFRGTRVGDNFRIDALP